MLKLNVDALVPTGSDRVGLGAVICDNKGHAIMAMAKALPGFFSLFAAECVALLKGL